jgi:hypothetical protein
MFKILIGLVLLVVAGAFVYLVFRASARWDYSATEIDPMADIKTCPYCSEDVRKSALFCRHCKSNLD